MRERVKFLVVDNLLRWEGLFLRYARIPKAYVTECTFEHAFVLHRKKRFASFPSPSRDVTTKLSLGGNYDVITE